MIELIKKNKEITVKEFSKIINVSPTTIKRYISRLKELNILKRVGSKKKGYWEVI